MAVAVEIASASLSVQKLLILPFLEFRSYVVRKLRSNIPTTNFFCDAYYQGVVIDPLQLPATIFFIGHMHITVSPHLAHHTETSFEIIYANFIRQHIMI